MFSNILLFLTTSLWDGLYRALRQICVFTVLVVHHYLLLRTSSWNPFLLLKKTPYYFLSWGIIFWLIQVTPSFLFINGFLNVVQFLVALRYNLYTKNLPFLVCNWMTFSKLTVVATLPLIPKHFHRLKYKPHIPISPSPQPLATTKLHSVYAFVYSEHFI